MPDTDDLNDKAYELCVEVWDGKWEDALSRVPNGQPAACDEVIAELARRCPGHSREEYENALARGMHDSMF